MLTLAQPGEQHDLPANSNVVMRDWLLHLDLPESSYLLPDEFLAPEDIPTPKAPGIIKFSQADEGLRGDNRESLSFFRRTKL